MLLGLGDVVCAVGEISHKKKRKETRQQRAVFLGEDEIKAYVAAVINNKNNHHQQPNGREANQEGDKLTQVIDKHRRAFHQRKHSFLLQLHIVGYLFEKKKAHPPV